MAQLGHKVIESITLWYDDLDDDPEAKANGLGTNLMFTLADVKA